MEEPPWLRPEYHEFERLREWLSESNAVGPAASRQQYPRSAEVRAPLGRAGQRRGEAAAVPPRGACRSWRSSSARAVGRRGAVGSPSIEASKTSRHLNAAIKSDADRTRAEALYHRFTEVADAGRRRAIPMAAAIFVLGAALLALASRGLAGKTNTRNALVQVTTAQAIVVVLAYFVTRDIRNAELELGNGSSASETLPADQYEQVVPMMASMRRYVVPGWLVFRTIASALVVFAL